MTPMLLLLACSAPDERKPDADSDAKPSTPGTDGDTGPLQADDTAETTEPLPASCEPPKDLATNPVHMVGEWRSFSEGYFMELTDVEIDTERQLAMAVGQGGLFVFDISDPPLPVLLGTYEPEGTAGYERFYRIEIADDGIVYATHRDVGLYVLDTSDPAAPAATLAIEEDDLEGMAWHTDRLYVTNLGGQVVTYDVSDRDNPVEIARTKGLQTPWDLFVDPAGGVAYVADNGLGVVVLDLSDPDAPSVAKTVSLASGVRDLALGDGVLYAAVGTDGVVTLDRTDPLAPTVVHQVPSSGAVHSIAFADDRLYTVDQQRLAVLDASKPAAPRPISSAQTEQWAMHVAAAGPLAFVGDWGLFSIWTADDGVSVPDLDYTPSELYIGQEPGTATVTLTNRGSDNLEITGANIDDDAISLSIDKSVLSPGERAELLLDFAGDKTEANLCIASNDPDEPRVDIVVHSGGAGDNPAVGQRALDFVLEDLSGKTWQLSDQLGHPVVLVYFATW